ncbi:PKD domain-containing protein [Trichloromonas sp.]|uniref:PKD domain-containing protein n=1 Tax=Trichloromonas sp. TaxID=3069249 RepID=UPI003D818D9B
MRQPKRNVPELLAIIILFIGLLPPVAASAATNDNFDNAFIISSLPFSDSVDNSAATIEVDEPQSCYWSPHTVWYSYTPTTDGVVRADMSGSSIDDTNLSVYLRTAPGLSGLSFITCASYTNSAATFAVQAGMTYYLQVESLSNVGNLNLNLQIVPPPANDDFSNAAPIAALPFQATVDTSGATLQDGEPSPPCAGGMLRETIWYAFTAAMDGPVSISISAPFQPLIAVYAGSSLTELTELGCQTSWGQLTFQANAGVVYYLQLGSMYGPGGHMEVVMDVTPAPVANFFFYPSDPSVYDAIQFYDNSYDPGQIGFHPAAWDFGDGTMASDCCPVHQYLTDNDYTVNLTATTLDGRTASASQVVQVRSHDVAIIKFTAPQAARAGQTRQLNVAINSRRYPDTVQVQLLKSVPGGFETVGMLTQYVLVRSGNRTTNFNFSYTFTPTDAATGKVTFKAVALIAGNRDVLPADNEAIAFPTKVAP